MFKFRVASQENSLGSIDKAFKKDYTNLITF